MKDFFIKIRRFKEAFSESSENPQQASVCMELGKGARRRPGFQEGWDRALGVLSPSCRHRIPPPGREGLSLLGHCLSSYPLLTL